MPDPDAPDSEGVASRRAAIEALVRASKVHDRVLQPLLDTADLPPAPTEPRQAMRAIDRTITSYLDFARLGQAA